MPQKSKVGGGMFDGLLGNFASDVLPSAVTSVTKSITTSGSNISLSTAPAKLAKVVKFDTSKKVIYPLHTFLFSLFCKLY